MADTIKKYLYIATFQVAESNTKSVNVNVNIIASSLEEATRKAEEDGARFAVPSVAVSLPEFIGILRDKQIDIE